SLRMVSNASDEVRTSSRARRCSEASSVSSTSSTKPSTAFIGVRISWLMLARKALRARATRSARSRASRIAASAALRSLMSSYRATSAPSAAALTAAAERRTWMRRPSLRIRSSSTRTTSPRRSRFSDSLGERAVSTPMHPVHAPSEHRDQDDRHDMLPGVALQEDADGQGAQYGQQEVEEAAPVADQRTGRTSHETCEHHEDEGR